MEGVYWQAIYSLNLHQLIQQSNEQGEEYAIVNTISQVAEQLFIQDESHKSPQRTHSTVRGQLTVKQLYELYESGQPQSKYGRYQVRKRAHKQGCIEPITDEPEIIVHQQEQTLALNATAIRFWEALRLEPFGGKKTLIPVMLCPVGDAMEASARQMIKELACLLGTHRAINGMEVVPVILLPSMTEESTYNRQLRSLTAAFEKLGGQLPAPTNRDTSTIVIYVINPFPDHFKHLLAICQCFEAMVYAYRKRGLDAEQLALQIIPYQLVNNPNQRATDHAAVCKTLAFSAYTRAFRRLTVLDDHGLTFGCDYKRKSSKPAIPIYAPPYTLVNDALRKFELNLPADIHAPPLFRANHLHVAYTGPLVGSRMICVWTDDSGEVLESDSWIQSTTTATTIEESIKETVTQVWQRSQLMVQRWFNEPCSITIVRKGIMNSVEFEAWLAICGDDSPHVILACMADEPTLRIQLPTTERCSGEPPNGNIKSHTALAPDAGLLMKTVVGEVYLVDVGHRLAISNETIEPKNSVSSNYYRRQLLPLASGSLFWLPDAETLPDASTCRLQIHLLRSPSSVSANMTLRELLLRYYALSFIHFSPNFAWAPLPVHLRVLQQLVRLVECQSIS
ncbi:mediator complex subunit 13 C-terminal-domain-containing protein [Syncephalis plumigaleata]|nr:mediator complex subunit 13 C-terminal-domain-containing protein [Syncephalis plumigaleata]